MFEPLKEGEISEAAASTRRAITWKMVDGAKCVKARMATEGLRGPPGASALAPLICRSCFSELSKNGVFGALISSALLRKGMSLLVMLFYAPRQDGIPRMSNAFGSCMRRPMI